MIVRGHTHTHTLTHSLTLDNAQFCSRSGSNPRSTESRVIYGNTSTFLGPLRYTGLFEWLEFRRLHDNTKATELIEAVFSHVEVKPAKCAFFQIQGLSVALYVRAKPFFLLPKRAIYDHF